MRNIRSGYSTRKTTGTFYSTVRKLTLCVFIFSGSLFLSPWSFAQEKVFKWTDAEGVVHFTDRLDAIPARFRAKVEERTLEESARPEKKTAPSSETKPESTDVRGRDKAWWLAQKKYWSDEASRLRKQIDQNNKDMAVLHQGRVRQGERTKEGIILNKGPRINDYRELKWLQQITSGLGEDLKKAEFMLREGLVHDAYRAAVPSEWIEELKKKDTEASPR